MPLLGSLLVSLVGGLASFFAQFLARKVAVVAAGVAALTALTTGALLLFNAAITPMLGHLFETSYGQFLGLVVPPASGTCMAIIGANWAAVALYQWQKAALMMSVQA